MPSQTTIETGQGILSTLLSRPTTPSTPGLPLTANDAREMEQRTGSAADKRGGGSMAHRPAFHHSATDHSARGAGLVLNGVRAGPGSSGCHGHAHDAEPSRGESSRRSFPGKPMDWRRCKEEERERERSRTEERNSDWDSDKGYSNMDENPYSYPSEKRSPPPTYTPSFSQYQSSPTEHSSPARDRLLPPIDLAEGGFVSCAKRKLMGKEGGLGMALMLGWVVTTVGFLVATAFWRGELFGALDRMSKHLHSLGLQGKGIFLLLILLTTIPPLPLYSTLMVLAGYTFGVWEGFVVSYLASLSGAVLVFVVSRCWLRDVISRSLQSSPTAQTLLSIIPANPHLLLLIRIAPYPYNLLNVILASAPTLTLRTYTTCTAISLLKLVLHTWIGAGIHDIASYGSRPAGPRDLHGWPGEHDHSPFPGAGADGYDAEGWEEQPGRGHGHGHGDSHGHYGPSGWTEGHGHVQGHGYGHAHGHGHGQGFGHHDDHHHRMRVKMYATWVGIALCVGLFFYLTHLAKRALKKAQAEEEARREGGVRLRESEEC